MHCTSCGRDNELEECVHTIKYSQYEMLFLLLLVVALPAIIYGVFFNIYLDFDLISYFLVGSISISIVLVILLIAYFGFKKLYIAIFFGCHQKSSRSISFRNKSSVLCARCTGILFGMFFSLVIAFIDFNYWWLILFSIPMIIDGVIQSKTNYVSNNAKRFITGFMSGPSFVLIYGFVQFLISRFIITLALNIV